MRREVLVAMDNSEPFESTNSNPALQQPEELRNDPAASSKVNLAPYAAFNFQVLLRASLLSPH